jgi:cyclase
MTTRKPRPTITILNTGIANTASVAAAFTRLGAQVDLTDDADRARAATHLVLPGVGAFGPGIDTLRARNLDTVLTNRIADDRPTLCVCLGLQLLCATSDETPGARGLGVIDAHVAAFPDTVRTPQFGWNSVDFDDPDRSPRTKEARAQARARFLTPGHAYFANSYRLTAIPEGWSGLIAHHAGPFVAALERGNTLACQFHPELSGPWGLDLLERWMTAESGAVVRPEGRTTNSPASTTPPSTRRAKAGTAEITVTPGITNRVIPCLDIRDGRVVKGVKFQNLRDAGDPVEQSTAYESQTADEIVILDVSATPEGRSTAVETVAAVRANLSIPLTVGGGVKKLADALALLDAGADKVGINSAAVENPAIIRELADRVGTQCVVLAIDAARRLESPVARGTGVSPVSSPFSFSPWEVVTRSGTHRTGLDAVEWARTGAQNGAGEILLTSYDRDGTHEGYDLDLIRAIAAVVNVPIIASGGASNARHMADAIEAGADAVLAASIFHDGHTTVRDIKDDLAVAGVRVRRDGALQETQP